jgi:hypothetical protein
VATAKEFHRYDDADCGLDFSNHQVIEKAFFGIRRRDR